MKKIILVNAIAVAVASYAASTLEEAVAASGWTVEELITALELVEAKYNRDTSTKDGRKAWHGRAVREEVDTNTLTKVTYYEDGATFTDKAKVTKASDNASVLRANAKLKRAVMTNGVPVRLAAARIRNRDNAGAVSNVTVTISAGK